MTQWHLNNRAWWDKFSISLNTVGSHYDCCPRQTETSFRAATVLLLLNYAQSHSSSQLRFPEFKFPFISQSRYFSYTPKFKRSLISTMHDLNQSPNYDWKWWICQSADLYSEIQNVYSTSVRKNQIVLTLCTMKEKA